MKKVLFLLCVFSIGPISAADYSLEFFMDYYGDAEESTAYDNLRNRYYLKPAVSGDTFNGMVDYNLSLNLYYQIFTEENFPAWEQIIREGFIGIHGANLDLYLGQKYVNWGKVDFFSPINIINPIDTTLLSLDKGDEAKFPDLMAHLLYYPSFNSYLELVYIPFLQPYYYPETLIPIFYYIDLPALSIGYDIDVLFKYEDIPPYSEWANSIFLSFNYLQDWADFLLSYSYYTDQYTDFDLSGLSQQQSGYMYILRGEAFNTYRKAHHIGIGFSSNIEGWGFNGEAALKITENWEGTRIDTKKSDLTSNLQISKTFFRRLFCQVNGIYRYHINFNAEVESQFDSDIESTIQSEAANYFLQAVENQVYLVLHLHQYFFNDKLYLGVNSAYGFVPDPSIPYEEESYLAPRLEYQISDYVRLQTGADFWLTGEESGYLGRNIYNDNFYVRLVCKF